MLEQYNLLQRLQLYERRDVGNAYPGHAGYITSIRPALSPGLSNENTKKTTCFCYSSHYVDAFR